MRNWDRGLGVVSSDLTVDPDRTAQHATHARHDQHFCSAGCRTKFVAEPQRYPNQSGAPAAEVPPGSVWTCPMHPEIRQDHPGACPICGMGLEPELVTADAGPSAELTYMSRRLDRKSTRLNSSH